jgi:hypothetical protein
MVLFESKLPMYQACVFPFPICFYETYGLDLLKDWQFPKAPFIVTYREQYTIKTPSDTHYSLF